MPDPLRIVQLNLAYDRTLASADALLARYHTLTGWSRATTRAGAAVHVVQRFSADDRVEADGVIYDFVRDGRAERPDAWTRCERVADCVRKTHPDVVHINGLMFPGMVQILRRRLPPATTIVLQDHSGHIPRSPAWPLKQLAVRRWRRAFAAVDACTFTASDLASPWFALGLSPGQTLLEIPEASTELFPVPRIEAARSTGFHAAPVMLWVGRLDANKDPLTVLAALELACPRLPGAHCWMIYSEGALEKTVRQRIRDSAILRHHVTCIGAVRHDDMARYYSASDILLSGSHHEGSGYALLEALACGVTPCVTDIPAFRALAASCGARWPAGDSGACAAALVALATADRQLERDRARQRFDAALSWDVIGQRTVSAYGELTRQRAAVRFE